MTDPAARLQCRAAFVLSGVEADPAYPGLEAPAITVSDRLRVRSDPGLESERYELLSIGTPVWVVDGPVIAADYEWFRIVVPGLEVDGLPRIGWVAASDHGAERWLARHTIDCPRPDRVTVKDLDRLTRQGVIHGGLACFGSASLRLEGSVELICGAEARPGWRIEPEWLFGNAFHTLAISSGTTVVNAHVRPELGVPGACDSLEGASRSIRGHFDDPDAGTCDGAPPNGVEIDMADVLIDYWCRTAFVVDAISPMPGVVPTPRPSG